MHPFFFGSSNRPLFGMYHAPNVANDRTHAVLICNAFGHEATRSHRLMRQLAEQLATDGEHVLRFDYFGTGDSGGDADDENLDGWVSDTRTALQELLDMSAVSRVTIIGLRLGAVVGVHAARGCHNVDRLLLWDPIVSGEVYLEELATLHEARTGQRAQTQSGEMPASLVGFALGAGIGVPLSTIQLADVTDWPVRDVGLVVSEKLSRYDRLHARLSERVGACLVKHVPSAMRWNDVSHVGELLQAPEAVNALKGMLMTRSTG